VRLEREDLVFYACTAQGEGLTLITIYIDGRNFGRFGTAYGVLWKFGTYAHRRSFECGKITTNQAEMKAVEYVFKCFQLLMETHKRIDLTDHELSILSTGRYVQMMLERAQDHKWVREPQVNVELIKSVREIAQKFANIKIQYYGPNADKDVVMESVKTMTEETVKKNILVFKQGEGIE
jgi:hypothetical protein